MEKTSKKDSRFLFNAIAPIYGLFYQRQRKRYTQVIDASGRELGLDEIKTILDVGCGTGALCSVFNQMGLQVTGVDPAEKMLNIARKKSENKEVVFTLANVLDQLPFQDKSFDITIASYVAHGMSGEERRRMYAEMSRITKSKVVIYDYNTARSILTSVVEWMEKGDYFNFIRSAEDEMTSCVSGLGKCFSDVKTVNVDVRAAWYICTPN